MGRGKDRYIEKRVDLFASSLALRFNRRLFTSLCVYEGLGLPGSVCCDCIATLSPAALKRLCIWRAFRVCSLALHGCCDRLGRLYSAPCLHPDVVGSLRRRPSTATALTGLPGASALLMLPYSRRSSFRPCCASPSFLWCRCWVTRFMEVCQRPMSCLAMLTGLEPAPSEACVRFPTPLYNLPAAPVCRLQHHVRGLYAGPVAFIAPACAQWSVGCMRSVLSRRWVCAVACVPTRSRVG